ASAAACRLGDQDIGTGKSTVISAFTGTAIGARSAIASWAASARAAFCHRLASDDDSDGGLGHFFCRPRCRRRGGGLILARGKSAKYVRIDSVVTSVRAPALMATN